MASVRDERHRRDEQAEHRGCLGQENYSVWYYNSRHMSLYIYPNTQYVQHKEWILILTMDLRWQWCVNVLHQLYHSGVKGCTLSKGWEGGGKDWMVNFLTSL